MDCRSSWFQLFNSAVTDSYVFPSRVRHGSPSRALKILTVTVRFTVPLREHRRLFQLRLRSNSHNDFICFLGFSLQFAILGVACGMLHFS